MTGPLMDPSVILDVASQSGLGNHPRGGSTMSFQVREWILKKPLLNAISSPSVGPLAMCQSARNLKGVRQAEHTSSLPSSTYLGTRKGKRDGAEWRVFRSASWLLRKLSVIGIWAPQCHSAMGWALPFYRRNGKRSTD